MRAHYDSIVVGGGHNGLVCAATLAKRGQSVLVLEAGPRLGGAAATREFCPGYRVSAGAHLLHLMPARLLRDLGLAQHGLEIAARAMPTLALAGQGEPIRFEGDGRSISGGASPRDVAAYAAFADRMTRLAQAFRPILEATPPRLGTDSWDDRLGLARMGLSIRLLGRSDMRELLRIVGMNVYDLVDEHFEQNLLKGAVAFDALLGANAGPRSPGSVLTLLYRLAAETGADTGLAQPKGGMGGLIAALAAALAAAGGQVRTEAKVTRIRVEGDRATGVELAGGETISADRVISNADPRTTFLDLVGSRHLDTGFVRKVDHIRRRGLAAKLHLALDRAPQFQGLKAEDLGARLLIAPSPDYLEHAFNHSKYGETSEAPALEIVLPSVGDPSLAPPGHHVLSAIVQYAPYALTLGWERQRARFTETVLDTIEAYAPGIRRHIVAAELLTPVDLEREFGMAGGHWHHAELALDQFLMLRPVPGAAQYRTPLAGLYLCGAGCHPGGGVMGVAGRNAATAVLADAKAGARKKAA